jgi:hypothetical protein
MDSYGMVDLGFSGNPFTWSNNRQGCHNIKEQLDRGIAPTNWIHQFPAFSLRHLPAHAYDHNPLLLNTSMDFSTFTRPFRFEEFWMRDPSCEFAIAMVWDYVSSGSPTFILSKMLKSTKATIKNRNSLHFGNIQKKCCSDT